jgi:hypothetical protein
MHLRPLLHTVAAALAGLSAAGCAAAFADPAASTSETSDAATVAVVNDEERDRDETWYPRTLTSDKGSAIVYAPQIDAWHNFETITAWVAFRISRTGSDDSYYGSLRFNAKTDTDIRYREILFHDVEVLDLSIDGLSDDSEEFALIRDGFTAMSRKVPLDLVLAYLPHSVPLTSVDGLNPEPPAIFVSELPAILVFVDGEPRFLPLEGTSLQFVLNTTWDVIRNGDEVPLYLCHGDAWLTADKLDGRWDWAETVPAEFDAIPDNPNWAQARTCLDENPGEPAGDPPKVFYSNRPAELLLTDGAPGWEAIGDHGLTYATNTEQELFRAGKDHYLLLSGRWFSAISLDGPWTLATELPDAFRDIPAEDAKEPHEMSYVRSSIPGTEEAWEAALIASVPRKAEIVRGTEDALDIEVTYAGEPVFAPIEETGIDLAVNTSYQVLRYDGVYYLCHNATWLKATSADGPWQFADSVPDQFSQIPPSSPAYNTTFVEVEGSDEESVQYAYKPGYEGAYVSNETVVQGTGYSSEPAISVAFAYTYASGYPYPYYPYYWYPPTYGYGSWYDPDSGRYGEAVVGYGPYGAAGGAAVYNPETGIYGRGQAVWDNDEFAGRGFAYNPNTDTSIARNRYVDFEDNEGWSERVARRGDEWRYAESEWQEGRMRTDFESSRGTEGTVYRERQGDSIVSEGTVTRGDEQATFETTRERQGDSIVSEGTISGDERSATVESVIDDGSYSGTIQGSEGGSGNVDRQLEDGQITGGTTFSKDGKTVETDVTRTAEGVQREFETSGGGQGVSRRSGDDSAFAYQTGSGDVYAGRDGNVYQRTDDGWQQVQNPGSQSAARERLSTYSGSQGSYDRSSFESSQRGSGRSSYNTGQRSNYDLNRDYQSRQRGYDRYQRHQSSAGRMSRGRAGYGRRGRR